MKFTFPFCYVPRPEIVEASRRMISKIKDSAELDAVFSEGKMLGILEVEDETDGKISFLFAFSGLAGGKSVIDGFVPPIFDLASPDGYYRKREAEISAMPEGKDKSEASRELQAWIFDRYIVSNALGESRSIREVFSEQGLLPPGGTGECAAPKLLQEAYRRHLKPLAMGEFWYGKSNGNEVRNEGDFYPSCTGKCGPLLKFMLQGLDVEDNPLENVAEGLKYGIVFEDDSLIVVDKPSGMLCVPGKTGQNSLLEVLQCKKNIKLFPCHRLDMDTSGLIIYARTAEVQSELAREFEGRTVKKTYVARLSASRGSCELSGNGIIDLPLSADYYDRPRQIVDTEHGKPAITEFKLLKIWGNGETDIEFTPLTGRTHQLRVHSAHPLGLGRPIKGDKLYGDNTGDRLYLHASRIEFFHPVTGERLEFTSPIPW